MTTGSEATTWVGLLRAVNLGKQRQVPMARLRELLTELGFGGVRTHLQSGNVLFSTDEVVVVDENALQTRLETALSAEFGFEVPCMVRTATELQAVLADCPWPIDELDSSKLLVQFLRDQPAPNQFAGVDSARIAPDEFRHQGRTIYCYFPEGTRNSKLPSALEAAAEGILMTGRTWRTVSRLASLAEQHDTS